jgi:hypothetical protein
MWSESDGPFVQVNGRPALPSDVAVVESHLAGVWRMAHDEVGKILKTNLLDLLRPIKSS